MKETLINHEGFTGIKLASTTDWQIVRGLREQSVKSDPQAFNCYPNDRGISDVEWILLVDSDPWFVYFEEGEPVGLAGIRGCAQHRLPEIVSVWVKTDMRQRGIGRHLVQTAINHVSDMGLNSVEIWVIQGNDRAARLYESLGFKATGETCSTGRGPDVLSEQYIMDFLSGNE